MQLLTHRNSRRLEKTWGQLDFGKPIQCKSTLEKETKMTSLMVSFVAFVAGVKDRLSSEKGATMVEYGIMVALIAVIVMAAVGPLGTAIAALFNGITGSL
jgi:pilus assembly protein Flp/PilA